VADIPGSSWDAINDACASMLLDALVRRSKKIYRKDDTDSQWDSIHNDGKQGLSTTKIVPVHMTPERKRRETKERKRSVQPIEEQEY
jgi:hypothetical protein